MKFVYISPKVENRIESLKKYGKAGNSLAQKVIRIIESLTSGVIRSPIDSISRYTSYGENRIKNCRKYDLGCGYRLITLQRGQKIFIPFFGTHDECQRWLENNSRLKKVPDANGTLFQIPDQQPLTSPKKADSAGIEENTEDDVMLKLSDKDLRRIFSGLVEGAKKRL